MFRRGDTYNVGLRSLQEMGPEAELETGRPTWQGPKAQASAETELLDPWAERTSRDFVRLGVVYPGLRF